MADEPPSLMTWARSQMRRKPASDDAPGTGGGLRLSRGLMIAIVLSCVVIVIVLTSDNGGTPATKTAESASPGASPAPGESPPGDDAVGTPPSGSAPPAEASKPPAAAGNSDRSTPVGTTAYTRDRQSLTVRTQPDNGSEVVARLGFDTALTLICHTEGPVVYGMNALRSSLWVKVTTPGGNTGYVPDAWIATEAEVPTLVAAC